MEYETWAENQETATVTVDEHDLEVAYYDDGDGEPVLFATASRPRRSSGARSHRRCRTTIA